VKQKIVGGKSFFVFFGGLIQGCCVGEGGIILDYN
jgi:hypothetical protein